MFVPMATQCAVPQLAVPGNGTRWFVRIERWVRKKKGDLLTPHDVFVGGPAIRVPAWQDWARRAKEKRQRWIAEEPA